MNVKFAQFVTDPLVCQAAQDHWRAVFAALPCRPLERGWTDWGTKIYVDRTGANIYAAQNAAARRGVMIVQCVTVDNAVQATAWTGWYGGDAVDADAIAYIKINVVHTDETERIAVELMTQFVCGAASLEEMDELMRQIGVA